MAQEIAHDFNLPLDHCGFRIVRHSQGVDAGLVHVTEMQRLDRLFTLSRFGLPLPISHLEQIKTVPGVTLVAPEFGRGGYWRDQKNGAGILAVDERWFAAFPEATIPKQQLQGLARMRTGLVITRACVDRAARQPVATALRPA